MTKLTRQERKEALAEYDRKIAACESLYDSDGSVFWARKANVIQSQRTIALMELEATK